MVIFTPCNQREESKSMIKLFISIYSSNDKNTLKETRREINLLVCMYTGMCFLGTPPGKSQKYKVF